MSVDEKVDLIDVRLIVRWLGPEGAIAGLDKSRHMTVDVLTKIGTALGLSWTKLPGRAQMIAEIVRVANKRIQKPVDELVRMSKDEIINYLDGVEPGREELLDLLKAIDVTPSKEGRKTLIEFAARELSETGRFMRIASPREAADDQSHPEAAAGKKGEARP